MAVVAASLADDGFRSADERRKRLGQYFTGVELARLLAALAGTDRADSVIDPMVGSGDMLAGTLAHGTPTLLGGVELDPVALTQSAARLQAAGLSTSALALGSAFDPTVLAQLPTRAWDVVITNPPYVRYQSTSRVAGNGTRIPSGIETRRDLIATIDTLDGLDDEDKRLFRELTHGYSGLADLAVPAWILCAGLVKVGGTLAMVVPTTWLSRDYAHPIRYLLRRWFDVTAVVEDGDASWFTDALVRTTLVVATRVPRRDSAFDVTPGDGYAHLHIDAATADERSLVGRLFPDADDPEVALAATLARWRSAEQIPAEHAMSARWLPAAHDADALRRAAAGERWLERVEPRAGGAGATERSQAPVPSALLSLTGTPAVSFVTLDELGWRAGQGLRTGANGFFYLRAVDSDGTDERLLPSITPSKAVVVPADASVPVLQRQADLPDGYVLRADELDGRALVLDGYALPEDLAPLTDPPYSPMPAGLAAHVRRAAVVNVGSADDPKYIPQLSAVITNVRAAAGDRPARFWYQLPGFTDRHQPSLLLARINNTHPRTLINDERRALVDANFSTLWPTAQSAVDAHALLAVLNSTWCAAVLELAGTVMGGGALKVEATHMRRVPVPALADSVWQRLSVLGHELADDPAPDTTLSAIDSVIFTAIDPTRPKETRDRVAALAAQRLRARSA
jgi:hypothetical protein